MPKHIKNVGLNSRSRTPKHIAVSGFLDDTTDLFRFDNEDENKHKVAEHTLLWYRLLAITHQKQTKTIYRYVIYNIKTIYMGNFTLWRQFFSQTFFPLLTWKCFFNCLSKQFFYLGQYFCSIRNLLVFCLFFIFHCKTRFSSTIRRTVLPQVTNRNVQSQPLDLD